MGVLLDRPWGANRGNPSGLSVLAQNVQGEQAGDVLPALQTIAVTTAVQIVNPLLPTLPLTVALPPQVGLEQRVFDLIASGYIKTTASGSITLKLYEGTLATGTLLKASSAQTQDSATAPFWIKGRFIYDSVSGKLTGTVQFLINNILDAEAVVTNVVTGLSDSNDPVATFTLTITSSGATGSTLTTINVQAFSAG